MSGVQKLNERGFLNELAELRQALRAEIEAKARNLDPSPAAVAERRRRVLADHDFEFFAYTYFPHHIWGEPSKFQAQFCDRFPKLLDMQSGCREWWVAPRGEAKSSLLTKIGPVYLHVLALLQRPEVRVQLGLKGSPPPFLDYVLLLGAETRLPTKLLEVCKTELIANAALRMDFPEVCGRGPVWKVGEFVSRTGVKVEPYGAEQAVRGTFHGASRPKVLLGDDLITDKEAKSPTERENRWTWLTKAIDYLGPPDGSAKYLGVGTILNDDDPISRAKNTPGHVVHHFKAIEQMPDRMDLWEQCAELMHNDDRAAERDASKKGKVLPKEQRPSFLFFKKRRKLMSKGAVISWPEVRSIYDLMHARATAPKAFKTEMQGEARNDEDRVFTDIRYWVQKLRHWVYFGGCDPSMGKGQSSDPSALVVGAYDLHSGITNVVEAASKRRVPSKLEADLIAMQREYNCVLWGFENNNAYEHSRMTFVKNAKREGVVLPLHGITNTAGAEVYIDSLEPFVNGMDPSLLFHPSLRSLIEQLESWPEKQSHHHYDVLIALWLLHTVAVRRGAGLPSIVTRGQHSMTNTRNY